MREPVAGEQGRIDLAFVRVRRVGAIADASAHMVLAGGPGDSGVNLVTNLAKQGGAALAEMFDGDIIGVDQRGTGRSRPNLDVPVLYGLPLDVAGSPEVWLPRIEQSAARPRRHFATRASGWRRITRGKARMTSRTFARPLATSS